MWSEIVGFGVDRRSERRWTIPARSARSRSHPGLIFHLLVELYARSAQQATEVLEEDVRGQLEITSLAGRGVPPPRPRERHGALELAIAVLLST